MNNRRDIAHALGRRIRQLRIERNLTQERFAEVAQIAILTVGNIERGTCPPRMHRLPLIAKALGVEVHELFLFDDVPRPEASQA